MNVKKLAFAPMINNGDLVGFVGIDNPTQSFDDLSVLKTISTIIYSEILKRKEGDEELYLRSPGFSYRKLCQIPEKGDLVKEEG